MGRATKVLEANQNPPSAYNPLIRDSFNRIFGGREGEQWKKTFGPTLSLQ